MKKIRVIFCFLLFLSLFCPLADISVYAQESNETPVDISAEKLIYDDEQEIVSAIGRVELGSSDRFLFADEVIMSVKKGLVIARGNVVLKDNNGDVHFAEEIRFTEQLSQGEVKELISNLSDGSHIESEKAFRFAGDKTVMRNVSYTPCDTCCDQVENGQHGDCTKTKRPVWRIVASEVVHDEKEKIISYEDAKFEIFGVPVAWVPYFAHPDGSIKQQSGFLTPSFSYDSEQGFAVENSYYRALSSNSDYTVGARVFSKAAPVVFGEYRKLWQNAYTETLGSITYSDRTDNIAGQDINVNEEWRGHIKSNLLWDMNDKWRLGTNFELVSDDQYLRQYDYETDGILENSIFLERFSGRNYAIIQAMAFQDVRLLEDRAEDQPNIIPDAQADFYGEPNNILGGRWHLSLSALGLHREGSGQDVNRAVAIADWAKKYVTPFGLASEVKLEARGDAYYITDSRQFKNDKEKNLTRGIMKAHMSSGYPLYKNLSRSQIVVEPKVALTISQEDSKENIIPNEDSKDLQIDSSNIFRSDRFSGLDKIEDESRVTYGINSGIYGHNNSHFSAFIGQSYRFDKESNIFPSGSGFEKQSSDLVGKLSAKYREIFGADYRFQLDSGNLSSERHEVEAYSDIDRISLSGRYLYAKDLENTNIDKSREQMEGMISYYLTDSWKAGAGALYDFAEDEGLRESQFSIDYLAQCVTLSGTVTRNLTRASTGDKGTEIMLRVGLKNLGEFKAPLTVSKDNEKPTE